MSGKIKKKWPKPTLVIIGEGRPEENVLTDCKSHAYPGGSTPTMAQNNCNYLEGNCGACQPNAAKGS